MSSGGNYVLVWPVFRLGAYVKVGMGSATRLNINGVVTRLRGNGARSLDLRQLR